MLVRKIRCFWILIIRIKGWGGLSATRLTIMAIFAFAIMVALTANLEALTIFFRALRIFTTTSWWVLRFAVVDVKKAQHGCSRGLFWLDKSADLRVCRCVHTVSAPTLDRVACETILEAVAVALGATIAVTIALYLTFLLLRCSQHGGRPRVRCLAILGHQPCKSMRAIQI